MIPWPPSLLVFVVALYPVMVLAVIWHEAGHVIFGRLAGYRVLAWGVGVRKPWLRVRLGRSFFYLARPLTGGLTIFCGNLVERRPVSEFFFVLGGPLFSLLGLVAGIALWQSGTDSAWLLAWIYISALFVVASAIPHTRRTGALRFDNDARLLIDILRHGSAARVHAIGPSLASGYAITELLDQVGNRTGACYNRLLVAILEASLGNFDAARRSIASGEACDPNDLPQLPAIAALAKAAVAVEANEDDAPEQIEAAAALGQGDATALFILDCLGQQWRLGRGEDIRPEMHKLRERAIAVARGDWLCTTEQLLFEAEPGEDDEARCRQLLKRHQRHLPDTTQARLLAMTTERLAVRGQHERARALFAEAQRSIALAAAGIVEPGTRKAFQLQASAPLRRAVAAGDDDKVPLFVGEAPTESVSPRRKSSFSVLSAYLGMAALAIAVGYFMVQDSRQAPLEPETARGWSALLAAAWMGNLVAILIAVVRRERRWWLLFGGWLMAMLGLGLAGVAGMPNATRRARSADLQVTRQADPAQESEIAA